jgi:2-oxoisovalerate dehydrogenase E1 component alpha subunit
VRVLDDEGRAQGPWDPRLAPETLLRMLRTWRWSAPSTSGMYRAQRQGKTSFYMKCTGEEASRSPRRTRSPRRHGVPQSYRQQGLLIARGWPIVDMMNQIYSNAATG